MKRFCPICKTHSEEFDKFGFIPRKDARCPKCGSLERHRLIWLYIKEKTGFLKDTNKKMLHVAPEAIFQNLFQKQLGEDYLSSDICDPKAMVQMDITDINYPNNSFDYIYCSHVLEHIEDDIKAMKELHRVLSPEGWAILLVPIMIETETFEDFTIVDKEERLKIYGHPDHVRNYGCDYPDRLKKAGFSVDIIYPRDFLSNDEIKLMGITSAAGEIYFCKK